VLGLCPLPQTFYQFEVVENRINQLGLGEREKEPSDRASNLTPRKSIMVATFHSDLERMLEFFGKLSSCSGISKDTYGVVHIYKQYDAIPVEDALICRRLGEAMFFN